MTKLNVDLALVKKYNVPGPRYTSYPPATKFTDAITWPEVEQCLSRSQDAGRELSLYFHLPFCRSLCWYCGCTTVITKDQGQSARYITYLEKEMDLIGRLINKDRKVVQLHWGGGSPTFLSPQEIRRLGREIRQRFTFDFEKLEAGVEIDPRQMTPDHVLALREAGFNRASVGVQDFNPKVQQAVHRVQPKEMTLRVIEDLRQAGFNSLNIDLIYGLPWQTVSSFESTLDQILEIKPDRLAIFSYAHVPWFKRSQKILEKALPTPEQKFEILKLTIEKLTEQGGYVYIGMDHFARADDELAVAQRSKTLQRNFQGYSTRGGADIYSFGMSSISQAADVYWQNQKELPCYYQDLDAGRVPLHKGYILNADDQIRRRTIMRLMCDLSLDYRAMSTMLGIDFAKYFAAELDSLADLEADQLLQRQPGGLVVTESGRLLIRIIAMRFDRYLPDVKERRFSRTV